ncbi:hypothetical protein AVEN_236569-1 [Araneus ventricosus]|uniref:Uncharacterized protein n=1 Tax=Araneus ventricosus TaxID=182803 RepID=A0A4Y2WU49_ARAVE|nr:hypothetical protein AVEN_235805-1 [Araneus ventricosus]GBO40711.1 hypothetical protein AVEN_236569-1 [Araneus ventricosus]
MLTHQMLKHGRKRKHGHWIASEVHFLVIIETAVNGLLKLEFLDHGKEKTCCQGGKSMKFGGKDSKWNSKELKIQNSIHSFQFGTSMRG